MSSHYISGKENKNLKFKKDRKKKEREKKKGKRHEKYKNKISAVQGSAALKMK